MQCVLLSRGRGFHVQLVLDSKGAPRSCQSVDFDRHEQAKSNEAQAIRLLAPELWGFQLFCNEPRYYKFLSLFSLVHFQLLVGAAEPSKIFQCKSMAYRNSSLGSNLIESPEM